MITIGLLVLGVGGYFIYQTFLIRKPRVQLGSGVPPWEMALDQVEEVWQGKIKLDDPAFKKACPDLAVKKDVIPRELKACREELFKCWYKYHTITFRERTDFEKIEVTFPELDQGENLPFTLKMGEESFRFSLNSHCNDILLPEGFYWGNLLRPLEMRVFHTNGVKYFIDKFLVRNLDIWSWLKKVGLKGREELSKKISLIKGEQMFQPAVFLTSREMDAYCKFKNSQVLDSQIKTALTFHHGREKIADLNVEPPSSNSAPHPFGPRTIDSYRYQMIHEKSGFKPESCGQIFSLECRGKNPPLFFGMGWSGVSELLGGPMEFVKNRQFPRKNIHPSSYHFSIFEKAHEAGTRIFWDGEGNDRLDFNFGLMRAPSAENSFDVGFRCMRKVLL